MAFYNSDWECDNCQTIHEEIVEYPSGSRPCRRLSLDCPQCKLPHSHRRLLSTPAKLLSDRAHSVEVFGGSFDTCGNEELPGLPEIPHNGEVVHETAGGRPLGRPVKTIDAGDFLDVTQSRDYKAAKAERKEVKKRNKAKRERSRATRHDPNFSMRHNPLPGDPKF